MRYLILDLETLGVPNAADFLPLDEIEADGRLKDPVKIAADITGKQQALLDRAALDLDLARICAVGTHPIGDGAGTGGVTLAPTEEEEQGALEALALVLDLASRDFVTLITFNGHKYDLPLLMRRAKYLGVPFPKINLDRYKSPHIDLYEELTMRGAIKAHSLRWYMRRLGWTDLLEADPFKEGGSDVATAAAEGKWDDIAAHCRVDVTATLRLAQWLGVIPKAEPVL